MITTWLIFNQKIKTNMANNRENPLKQAIHIFERMEDTILSVLLILMIVVAVTQIALRNLFDSGILWGDELVRVLVLWLGLMGAMIASRKNHHISIDVISRYLPQKAKQLASLITSLFTAVVCGVMTWFSLSFVLMEKQDGMIAFAAIPAWVCESIIPFAFAVISIRYLVLSAFHIIHLFESKQVQTKQ